MSSGVVEAWSKKAMRWGRLSSVSSKSAAVRLGTGAPWCVGDVEGEGDELALRWRVGVWAVRASGRVKSERRDRRRAGLIASGPARSSGKGSPSAHAAPSDELLLLPDGDGFLEGVDDPAAGVEGGAAMGGGDGDEDAGFADGEAAEAMDDGDVADGEVLDGLGAEKMHLL